MLLHRIRTVEQARAYFDEILNETPEPYRTLMRRVLDNRDFWKWPASTKKHQTNNGGLAVHTAQVCQMTRALLSCYEDANIHAATVAAVWHDVGKIKDYAVVAPSSIPGEDSWTNTSHRYMVRHLVRSYAEFVQAEEHLAQHDMFLEPLSAEETEHIHHMILAHHGRQEWGSPVEPETAEAHALHAADMLSARFTEE